MEFKPDQLTPACRLWQFREYLPENKSMYWLYETKGEPVETTYNKGCHDVTKSRVHEVHQKALGYSAKVDPRTCAVPFLEKPERQCMHHLITIQHQNCEPREGFVYERLLDNRIEYRVFYCHTGDSFYIRKERDLNDFNNYKVAYIMWMDSKMQDLCNRFCNEYGIDFAELDILIDDYGWFYITDVNNVAGMGMTREKFKKPSDFDRLNELYIEQIKSL